MTERQDQFEAWEVKDKKRDAAVDALSEVVEKMREDMTKQHEAELSRKPSEAKADKYLCRKCQMQTWQPWSQQCSNRSCVRNKWKQQDEPVEGAGASAAFPPPAPRDAMPAPAAASAATPELPPAPKQGGWLSRFF